MTLGKYHTTLFLFDSSTLKFPEPAPWREEKAYLLLLLNTYCEALFIEALCLQMFFKLKICRT